MKQQRVTLKDVAEQLNISIGTIDRAIHGRGRINDSTKELIMQKLNELGYRPNRLARALGKHKDVKLAFLSPSHNPFWEEVINGAKDACSELMDYGLHIDFHFQNSDYDTINQIKDMEKVVESDPDGIIIAPLHPYLLATPINNAAEKGIPVITVNVDSKESRRIAYVGEDPFFTGKIVGTLYGRFLGGAGKIAVMTGSADLVQFQTRKKGFFETIKTKYPDINIVGSFDYSDDEDIAYEISKKLISEITDLKGIFANTANGTTAIGKAIRDLGMERKVVAVSYDVTDEMLELLDCEALYATVTQSPSLQGYHAVKLMHKILLEKFVPDREFYYTKAEIVTNSEQYHSESKIRG